MLAHVAFPLSKTAMARGVGVMFDVLHDLERQFRFYCREAIAATDNNQPVPCCDIKLNAYS
jgi:hypothetical protein